MLLNNPTLDAMGKLKKGIIPSLSTSSDEPEWTHPDCPPKLHFPNRKSFKKPIRREDYQPSFNSSFKKSPI